MKGGERETWSNDVETGSVVKDRKARKEQVLSQGKASVTRSIADAVVIKDGNLFFLSAGDGNVPVSDKHGYGLYFNDCRYLSGYELRLAGQKPHLLANSAEHCFLAALALTSPTIEDAEYAFENEGIEIKWERLVREGNSVLYDVLTLRNFALEAVEVPVSLHFRASFDDVFAIRGLLNKQLGVHHDKGVWKDNALHYSYAGADAVFRTLSICFDPVPEKVNDGTAYFRLKLGVKEKSIISVAIHIRESSGKQSSSERFKCRTDLSALIKEQDKDYNAWMKDTVQVESDNSILNKIFQRSIHDIHQLRCRMDGTYYYAAGIPWFCTLFGRDSVITALQMLAYNPSIAKHTLSLLASFQGKTVNPWRDEEPGKILHEYRRGEMAATGQIPHTPYYGTVDATPLFLILVAQYMAWTGDADTFHRMRPFVDRALLWLDEYADSDGDGYIDYRSDTEHFLINQGWKDSGNAIVNADGRLARPPIAVVEVQGYVYKAWNDMAELLEHFREPEKAADLRGKARRLQKRFNRDFWSENERFYKLALQKDGQGAEVISSNPGHALWSGIITKSRAGKVARRLMEEDMFSGWGIRTLSEKERSYDPVSYHLGSVWPHDNAIIAAGMKAYGCDKEAGRVCHAMIQAAVYFQHGRLPELFCGFSNDEYSVPVPYPVACHPQAWGAGTIPYMLQTLLGLHPDAFHKTLHVIRPQLPDGVGRLTVRGLRVGGSTMDLEFLGEKNDVDMKISKNSGNVQIQRRT